ncbi:hypothetical protein BKA61DRAFT_584819 [Leptodontidium sp. MPI-SDFR-AT-0119]|nr:hypothetical protein BKA61DRAFT_584819 [Leptodontidium sp. MPI-SDFR-AT-0119]
MNLFEKPTFGQKSGFNFNGKRPVPYGRLQKRDQQFCRRPLDTRPTIREALNFPDLQTLVRFFTDGPGRRDAQAITSGQCLADITYIRIVYRDDWAVPNWEYDVRYAYEAFGLLVANFDRMHLRQLQIHVTGYNPLFDVDSAGVWSLLKIRGLQTTILTSRPGEICPAVRRALKERLCWPGSEPWRPTGLENPGPDDWLARIGQQGQYAWLDQRYKVLHDRETVDARGRERRRSYARRYGVRHQARARRHWQVRRQAKIKRWALETRRNMDPLNM